MPIGGRKRPKQSVNITARNSVSRRIPRVTIDPSSVEFRKEPASDDQPGAMLWCVVALPVRPAECSALDGCVWGKIGWTACPQCSPTSQRQLTGTIVANPPNIVRQTMSHSRRNCAGFIITLHSPYPTNGRRARCQRHSYGAEPSRHECLVLVASLLGVFGT